MGAQVTRIARGVVSGGDTRGVVSGGDARGVRVVTWHDELVESIGVDPRSAYAEQFWLPVLGPSATWLMRRLVGRLESFPEGFDLDLGETSLALGLGSSQGRNSTIGRTIGRCVRFDVARYLGGNTLAVRRLVAPLPRRHLLRLPTALQEQHRTWESARQRVPAFEAAARRARLLALDLAELGEDGERIERHLARWGVHPAMACDAASWARSRHPVEDQAGP